HAGGVADAFELERTGGGRVLGEELVLHFTRDGELGLETLLLLGDDDQAAQILGHVVERAAKLGELVLPLDGNTVVKVALANVASTFVELVDGAGDATGELDAGPERRDLDNEEDADEHDEAGHPDVAPIAGLAEDNAEYGGVARIDGEEEALRPALR